MSETNYCPHTDNGSICDACMGRTKLRIYGQWAGNPKGLAENPRRCIVGVYPYRSMIESQCSRPRGYGKDGLKCKQHAKQEVS